MNAFSKPRSNNKLEALELDQKRQLCEWLLTPGLSYKQVKALILEEFKTSTNGEALTNFYQSYVGAYVLERRRLAVGLAQEVGTELKRAPGQFSEATIDALEQKAFELAQNPMVDPKEVKAIFSLVLKARDQSLQRDKFQRETAGMFLDWSQNEEAKRITASGATRAEKIEALGRTMFGEDWED